MNRTIEKFEIVHAAFRTQYIYYLFNAHEIYPHISLFANKKKQKTKISINPYLYKYVSKLN